MKKNKKIILGITILIIGISALFFAYKLYFEKNTLIEIYKKDNEYKVYLKNDENKEIEGYSLYKTFGININDNEEVKSLELNLTNNKLNGIIINYEETVENENAYKDLNDYGHIIDCFDGKCLLKYDSYYNLENNKNLFKDMKVSFHIWNEDYLVQTTGHAGQWNVESNLILDINEEEIVISNVGFNSVRFLKHNNNKYIYVYSSPLDNVLCKLFDENGKLLFETSKDDLIIENALGLNEFLFQKSIEYLEIGNYYYLVENEILSKYDFNGNKIFNTKKYDEILAIGLDYLLIYQKSDNSVYITNIDDTFIKRIDSKSRNFYNFYVNNDGLITITGSKYDYIEGPDDTLLEYIFNPQTEEIKFENQ